MKLTASTTTPTTTPCPSGADGRGLSPFKREVRVRVPASSTALISAHGPERSGYRLEKRSRPHQLARLIIISHRATQPIGAASSTAFARSLPGRIGLSGRLSVRARRPALAFGPKQVGFRYPVGSKPTLPDPSPFTVRGSTAPRERSNRQSLAQSCHLTTTPRERRCPSTP
jgi:hypothetical protein